VDKFLDAHNVKSQLLNSLPMAPYQIAVLDAPPTGGKYQLRALSALTNNANSWANVNELRCYRVVEAALHALGGNDWKADIDFSHLHDIEAIEQLDAKIVRFGASESGKQVMHAALFLLDEIIKHAQFISENWLNGSYGGTSASGDGSHREHEGEGESEGEDEGFDRSGTRARLDIYERLVKQNGVLILMLHFKQFASEDSDKYKFHRKVVTNILKRVVFLNLEGFPDWSVLSTLKDTATLLKCNNPLEGVGVVVPRGARGLRFL
jgi:hypothetical protein